MSDGVAEVKFRAASGSEVVTVLNQIKTVTKDCGAENAKILTQIRDQAKAEHEAAAAARGKNEAAREAARETAKANKLLREQAKAAKEVQREFDQMARFAGNVVKSLADTYGALEKIAGLKGFAEQSKEVADFEESLVRLRLSLENMPQDKFDKLVGKDGSKLVSQANKAGLPVDKAVSALKQIQAETSMGARVMEGDVFSNILKFASVADASPKEAGNALAQFADKFQMSDADMNKASGVLLQQGYQGSLEPNTIPKFVKASVDYKGMTGKSGIAGFSEMMAIANIVKDEGGTGGGQNGAAQAATYVFSMLKTMADPKKRAMFEKGLGRKVLDKSGHLDFQMLSDALGEQMSKDPAKFTQTMATYVRDSSARKALNAIATGAVKNKGTSKEFKALSNPDVAAGLAAVHEGNIALRNTAKGQETIQNNEALLNFYRQRKGTQEFLHNIRNAADENMTPEQALAEEAGGMTGTAAKASRYAAQARSGVFNAIYEKLGLVSSDPLQRAKEERDASKAMIANLSGNKEYMSRSSSAKELESAKYDVERLNRLIEILEEDAANKDKAQGVTVNNNIQIMTPGVEARVTQEAQPTQNKAQNGSRPTVGKAAGVR
jgi:hypothetical protein